jgi:hypothetical protein
VKEQGDPIPQAPIKASQSMALLVSLFNLRWTNLVRGRTKRQCPGYRLVVDDATSSTTLLTNQTPSLMRALNHCNNDGARDAELRRCLKLLPEMLP